MIFYIYQVGPKMIQHMDTSPAKTGDTTKQHDPENEMVDIWCLKKQWWMIYPPSHHTTKGRSCQEPCRHSWEAQVVLWPIRGTYCILPHRFSSWHQANSQAVLGSHSQHAPWDAWMLGPPWGEQTVWLKLCLSSTETQMGLSIACAPKIAFHIIFE